MTPLTAIVAGNYVHKKSKDGENCEAVKMFCKERATVHYSVE